MSFPNKPNLIVAGVNKAATTSLFMYLSAHPQICSSRIKETQYFLPLRYGVSDLSPIEDYWEHFTHCQDAKYVLESTAGYFYGGRSVANAIKDALGLIKIIILFRDPITRMFSFYKFRKNMLELDKSLSFAQYIDLCEQLPPEERRKRENNVYWGIEGGFYSKYLPDWFGVFGENNIKILFFENFVADPKSQLIILCQWLGIESNKYISDLETSIENKTQNFKFRNLQKIALQFNWKGESFWRAHPRLKKNLRKIYYAINAAENEESLSKDSRIYLESVFKPYNKELATQLINRGYSNLPNWLARELISDRMIETGPQIISKMSEGE